MRHGVYEVKVAYSIRIEALNDKDACLKVRQFLKEYPDELTVVAGYVQGFYDLEPLERRIGHSVLTHFMDKRRTHETTKG